MSGSKIEKLVSILMESPLYMTLSANERDSLLERLTDSYHFSVEDEEEESEVGYESSWAGINQSV